MSMYYPLSCVILSYFFVFAGLIFGQARALHLLVLLIPKISSNKFSSKLRLQNLPHLKITVFRRKKQPLCRSLLHGFISWFLRSIHFQVDVATHLSVLFARRDILLVNLLKTLIDLIWIL